MKSYYTVFSLTQQAQLAIDGLCQSQSHCLIRSALYQGTFSAQLQTPLSMWLLILPPYQCSQEGVGRCHCYLEYDEASVPLTMSYDTRLVEKEKKHYFIRVFSRQSKFKAYWLIYLPSLHWQLLIFQLLNFVFQPNLFLKGI